MNLRWLLLVWLGTSSLCHAQSLIRISDAKGYGFVTFQDRLYYGVLSDEIWSLSGWDVRQEFPGFVPDRTVTYYVGPPYGVVNDELIMAAREYVPFEGRVPRLYAHDGSQLTPIAYAYPTTRDYLVHKNELYFSGEGLDIPDGLKRELWKTDGQTISLVADLDAVGGSFPAEFAVFQDELYFNTNRGGRMSLWRTDGENVDFVSDFYGEHGYPRNLTEFQDHLYMEVWNRPGQLYRMNSDYELEVLEFEEGGTVTNLTVFQDNLYFYANGMFTVDGDTVVRVENPFSLNDAFVWNDWLFTERGIYGSVPRKKTTAILSLFDGTDMVDLYREDRVEDRSLLFYIVEYAELNDELYISFSDSTLYGDGIWKLTWDPCNFNGDWFCDAADIDAMSASVRTGAFDPQMDLDQDGSISDRDREIWVEDYLGTFFGDGNLDGRFDTMDFVTAFQVGEYEDLLPGNSTWAEGDWDGDGDFTSHDLVYTFHRGGYETGVRHAAHVLAEPGSAMMLTVAVAGLMLCGRTRRRLKSEGK